MEEDGAGAGFAPALTGALSAHGNIGVAMTIVAMCAYGIVVLAAAALPDTRDLQQALAPIG